MSIENSPKRLDRCWMLTQKTGNSTLGTPQKNFGPTEMVIVLPLCDRDSFALQRSLEWTCEMDGVIPTVAIVHQDGGSNRSIAAEVIARARACYLEVIVNVYPPPQMPRWPNGPNWAFQQAARFVRDEIKQPFFWMEPDCVPTRPGWFNLWQAEYTRAGKPMMGYIVNGRGHLNGTAVYPWNFADIAPKAMGCTDVAWDWVMKEETIHLCHHTPLLGHVWGVKDGKPRPYDGEPATFPTQADVDRIVPPGSVLFHRAKYTDLIDRLRERKHANRNPDRHLLQRPVLSGS